MDRSTVDAYEINGTRWVAARADRVAGAADRLAAFARRRAAHDPDAAVLDLGCGPAWHTAALGSPAIGGDASATMLDAARARGVVVPLVRHDAEALPFANGSLAGVWAKDCLQHLPAVRLPAALAEIQRVTRPGAVLHCSVTDESLHDSFDDPFGARHFARWNEHLLRHVVHGAGFEVEACRRRGEWIHVDATRARTLADVVGPSMRLLLVGLNPSLYSADVGVGFARPGNRFWPAALAAGIVEIDRDPRHAFVHHGVGFTDLAKRATARAEELDAAEFRDGAERLAALCEWLRPAAVCFVGLSGYRTAVDRRARVGWQSEEFGGVPAYVMPNPSGLNAHTNVDDLARHLRAAYDGAR